MKTPSKLSAALRARAAASRPPLDRQVSEEEMAAYLDGKLEGEERARVEEAISLDPAAGGLVRDLAMFDAAEPSPGDPAYLTPPEVARDWAALRRRLGRRPPPQPFPPFSLPLTIAASLLIIMGTWLWGWTQRNGRLQAEERLAEARAPQVNVEPYTLWQPSTRGVVPAEEPPPVRLEGRGDAIWLRLALLGETRHDAYRLEVRALDRPGEPLLWRLDGLALYSDGTFSVAFPRAALPPGTYELRVVGTDRGAEHQAAVYRIRVPAAPPAG